ncbi:MAG TPA: NUDIX domain-containing protein, partial [Candidatus Absconditabacterales bacterium]|nr:NUDIX domain-containing protein [Candidatus Absconditabacterales bacterium]
MKKDYSYGIVPIYVNERGENEFLVIHQKTKHGSYWGFPKGHMEKGENEIQAAKRELYEEVGIKDIEILENKSFETQYFFEENGEKIDKTSKYWIGLVDNKDVKNKLGKGGATQNLIR